MIEIPALPRRDELSPDLRSRLRQDGRKLILECREHIAIDADLCLDRLKAMLSDYQLEDRKWALSSLLRELLDLNTSGFAISIEEALNFFAFDEAWSSSIIYATYRDHVKAMYRATVKGGGDRGPGPTSRPSPRATRNSAPPCSRPSSSSAPNSKHLRTSPRILCSRAWASRVPLRHGSYMAALCRTFHLPQPGTTIKHYRLKNVIGMGGMGVVYAAINNNSQLQVALKMLRPTAREGTVRDRRPAYRPPEQPGRPANRRGQGRRLRGRTPAAVLRHAVCRGWEEPNDLIEGDALCRPRNWPRSSRRLRRRSILSMSMAMSTAT